MPDRDKAIIVGIRSYPGLSNLDGPENDAKKFHQWVTSKAGGQVKGKDAKLILSSHYGPMKKAIDARPTLEAVQRELDLLQEEAEDSSKRGEGFRAGRRLYLFFSGHGFEPASDMVALLMANATPRRGYHVVGKLYADYFRRSGIFDEVLLFMDCCREPLQQFPTNPPPYLEALSSTAPERGKWLHAFATKWSRKSREKKIDGVPHGIFTAALMRGLGGEARDPSGQITDETLTNFLHDHMKDPLTRKELEDPDIPKQPDIDYDKDPTNRLVIARGGKATGFRVVFNTRPGSKGKELVVSGGQPLKPVLTTAVTVPAVSANLAQGLYKAQIAAEGLEVLFQVPGTEPGGVTRVDL
jgi:hypothetical protein